MTSILTGPSRYAFVGSAAQAPGQCLLSGQSSELVDTGRWIQGYGRVYLSVDTIRELAQSAGIVAQIDATVQQVEWYNDGYAAATAKEYDATLRDLVRQLNGAADRLELATGVAPAEDAVPDAEELAGEPADAGDIAPGEPADPGVELREPDPAGTGDERAPRPARSGKGRERVQRSSLDDAFGR